jgi:6-phosphogluconate dehydrogenase
MLAKNDVLIDGGNSCYKDPIRRAHRVTARGIQFVDVGTSGGIWGLKEGYCMMIGGDRPTVERLTPIFKTLAPGTDHGWGYVGPHGAGHSVKMIHNAIEYGMMEATREDSSSCRGRRSSRSTSSKSRRSGGTGAWFVPGSWI